MKELIKTLEQRNYWITKYLKANEAFIAVLDHAPDMAIQELDFFYGNRESLLKIIGSLDKSIKILVEKIEKSYYLDDSAAKTKINYLLREKDSMIKSVVDLDEKIIAGLEVLLKKNADLLTRVTKGKKALAKYKSSNKYNEKLDKQA